MAFNAGRVEAELSAIYKGKTTIDKFERDVGRVKRLVEKEIHAEVDVKGADQAERKLNKTARSIGKLKGEAKGLNGGLLSATTALSAMSAGMAGATVATAGLMGAVAGIKTSVSFVEEMTGSTKTLMSTMRLGAEDASQWAELLRVYGINAQTAGVGFARLNKNIVQASTKTGPMRDAFAALGISGKQLKDMSIEDIIKKTGESFKDGVPSQKAGAAAMQVFGRNYKSLLPILRGGATAIDKNKKLIKEYGAYLGVKGLEDAGKFKQAQREMKIGFDAIKIAVGQKAIPALLELMPTIRAVVSGMRGKGKFKDFGEALHNVASVAKTLGEGFVAIMKNKTGMVIALAAIGGAAALAFPQLTALAATIAGVVAAYKWLDDRARRTAKKDQSNANRVANDPTGRNETASNVRGASGATKRILTAPPGSLNPRAGSGIDAALRSLSKRGGGQFAYKASVALNTENAGTKLRVLDAAVKSKLSKPKILKILGDKRSADDKIKLLEGKKIPVKTAKVRGDTRDADGKIRSVQGKKIEDKNFFVRAKDEATSVLHDVKNTLSDIASQASSLPGKLWKKLFGRVGGRMQNLPAMAGGGRVPGMPVPKDNMLAMLSPGEFIVTGDGEKRLEGLTFPGVLNWLEANQMPHFAAGGRAGKRKGNGKPSAPANPNLWANWLQDRDRTFEQLQRGFSISDGQTTSDEYGKLTDYKSATLRALRSLRGKLPQELKRAYRGLEKGRRDMRSKRSGSAGDKIRRNGEATANRYKDLVATLKAYQHDFPFTETDLKLDLAELASSRATMMQSGISARSQEWVDFQASRANAFSSFGSNFVSAGSAVNGAGTTAGYRYFGAGAKNALAASGSTISITNNFQQGPADAHTWSRGIHYELGALV
jgi:hypothetical protein